MTRQASPFNSTLLPASLAASGAGTWEHDVLHGRIHYCQTYAHLYGLPPNDGPKGIALDDLTSRVHPDDRARRTAKCSHMSRHGGVVVFQYRILPSSGVMRWIMLRGLYRIDPTTGNVHGRGIAIDVSEGRQDGPADGGASSTTRADGRTAGALDRAKGHIQGACQAFRDLGAEGDAQLWPAAEALLLEIAHQLAGAPGPVMPSRTRH